MLSCREVEARVTDHLEGALPRRAERDLRAHLAACPACRAYVEQMQLTAQAARGLDSTPVPTPTVDALVAQFERLRPADAEAPSAAPLGVRLLERLGSVRATVAWLVAAIVVGAVGLGLVASGLGAGPLGHSGECFFIELGTATAIVGPLWLLARSLHARLASGTLGAIGAVGALGGLALVELTCPLAHVMSHALVFHLGGVVGAALLGAAAARLPAWR